MKLAEEVNEWLLSTNKSVIFDESTKENVIDFKVGENYYINNLPNKYKIHICSIVDDEMVVYKYFGKNKQWWHYFIKSRYELTWDIFRCEVDN